MPQHPKVRIFEQDSSATQSMNALMLAAQELEILTYLAPIDMRDMKIQVPSAIKLIWPNTDMDNAAEVRAKRKLLPDQDIPQDQRGQYYLVGLRTDENELLHIFIPEGHVVPFVFALAAKAGADKAERVLYRYGLLPTV